MNEHGEDKDNPDDDALVPSLHAEEEESTLQAPHDAQSEHGAEDGAAAAVDRDAAEDACGDRVQLEQQPQIRGGGGHPRGENSAREPRHGAAEGVDEQLHAAHGDTRVLGPGLVEADGVDLPACARASEEESEEQGEDDEVDELARYLNAVGEVVEAAAEGSELVGEPSDGVAPADADRQAPVGGHSRQGDDEWGDAEAYNEGAVDEPRHSSDEHSERRRQPYAQMPIPPGDPQGDRGQGHDGAHGEVHAAGDDDEGHGQRDQPNLDEEAGHPEVVARPAELGRGDGEPGE